METGSDGAFIYSMTEIENLVHAVTPKLKHASTVNVVDMIINHGGSVRGLPFDAHTHSAEQLAILSNNPKLNAQHAAEAHFGGDPGAHATDYH
jgi:hypothetical protein